MFPMTPLLAFLIFDNPALVVIFLPVLLFSLTFHEAAHAWMAQRLGDPTARMLGRLSLNPMVHLDPFGTLMLVLSDFRFGWAKPVPVDVRNFADPKRGIFLTAAAGPASNIILAVGCGLVFRLLIAGAFGDALSEGFARTLARMFGLGLVMNLSLATFNLIPLPPLDGSKILFGLAPRHWELGVMRLERVGPMILMGLIFAGFMLNFSPIWMLIGPIVATLTYALCGAPLGVLWGFIYG